MSKSPKKIIIIIQARMGSSRLPGKVLKKIEGRSMLWHIIDRLSFCHEIDEIVLTIPDTEENDILEKFAKSHKTKFYRGEEKDVLARYYRTAKKFKGDLIVRITSDCPLISPKIVDLVIQQHINSDVDYTSNVIERTFPRGMDIEVFSFNILRESFEKADQPYQREHVTPYISENPSKFKLQNIKAKDKLNHPEFRLTVDTEEDFKLIQEIYKHLYNPGKLFLIEEVVDLLKNNSELAKINALVKQKRTK